MNARAIVPADLHAEPWFSALEPMVANCRNQPWFQDVVRQMIPEQLHRDPWTRLLFSAPDNALPQDESAVEAANMLRSLFRALDPSSRKERRTVTRQDLVQQRSSKPLWELANTHVPYGERYPCPPNEMCQLHRRVSNNMSGFTEIQSVIAAHIAMELATRVAKFSKAFGDDQTGHGGPYYTFARTRTSPPTDESVHSETVIKGYMQLAKTVDEVAQAWADFFLEGLFPVIFLRLKGGALVATRDVAQTVHDFNEIVRDIYRHLYAKYYRNVPGVAQDGYLAFYLTPRCASRGEGVEFVGGASYRLSRPQVLIACTNVNQLKTIFYPGRALALSLAEIFSGVRLTGQDEDANPYLPYAWDESATRVRPAISAIFDEDDQNRSATGREAKDRMLFQEQSGCNEMLAALRAGHDEDEDDEEMSEEEQRSLDKFYETLRGLRALFASVTAWSATPTTPIYSIGNSASEVVVHMVEIVPGRNYIGYDMPRIRQIAPHCTTFVHVKEMSNRQVITRMSLSQTYGILLQSMNLPRLPPPPFKIAANGTVTLPKKHEDELVHGTNMRARELRDKARVLNQNTRNNDNAFWRIDGENVLTMLRDLESKRGEYPYRNALIMTPSTLRTEDKGRWAKKILSLKEDGLTDDLLTIEWSHKTVRFGWVDLDEDEFDHAALEFQNDPEAAGFVRHMQTKHDGNRTFVTTTVANINMAYSIAHAYMRRTNRFLKIVVLAGEIGGRGVRYKTHVGHHLVLTDMFYSFAVLHSKALTVTAAAALQAVGRLCTMVPDPSSVPKITLWIPRECWAFVSHWMKVMDSLPMVYEAQLEGERIERTVDRLLVQRPDEFRELARHFATATGSGGRGKRHHACLDHRRQAARRAHFRTATLFQETGVTLPRPVDTDYGREERLVEDRAILELHRMDGYVDESEEDVSDEEEDESDEEEEAPLAKRTRGADDLDNLRSRHDNATTVEERNQLEMQMWVSVYKTYILRDGAKHNVQSKYSERDYIHSAGRILDECGVQIWTSLHDVPRSSEHRNDTCGRVTQYYELHGEVTRPGNMVSHLMKAVDLFPPHATVGQLRRFLLKEA
jgi:hypothetical protein